MKLINKFKEIVSKTAISLSAVAMVCSVGFSSCNETEADDFAQKAVEEIVFEKSEIILRVDETMLIHARVEPIDATNRNVVWSIAEGGESYATITKEGKVTGIAQGNTKIIATSVDNKEISAECVLKVQDIKVPVASVEVKPAKVEVEAGKSYDFAGKEVVLPANADMQGVSWAFLGTTELATITPEGVLSAIKPGVVTVVAIADQNSSKQGKCEVTIVPAKAAVESVVITAVENDEVVLDATTTFAVTVSPADSDQGVVWSLKEATSCAIIDSATGTLTTTNAGKVTVVATSTSYPDMFDEYEVTIVAKSVPATAVAFATSKTLEFGSEFTLSPVFTPADANENTDLVWTTSNAAVATVVDGVVTAQNTEGEAVITATSQSDATVTASCKVKVVAEIIEMPDFTTSPIAYLNALADQNKASSKTEAKTLSELAPDLFVSGTPVKLKAMFSGSTSGNQFAKMLCVSDASGEPNSGILLMFTGGASNSIMDLTGEKLCSEVEITLDPDKAKAVSYGGCKIIMLSAVKESVAVVSGSVLDYTIPVIKAKDLESHQGMVVKLNGITATNKKQGNADFADGTMLSASSGGAQNYIACTDSDNAPFSMFFKGAVTAFKTIPYKAGTGDLTGLVQYYVHASNPALNLIVVGPRTPEECAAFQ